jgi:DnaD/phage-associated family protein
VSAPRTVSPLNDRQLVEVPEALLFEVVPTIRDMGELQLTLAFLRMTLESGGVGEPIAHEELLRDPATRHAFREEGTNRGPDGVIERSAELAVGRGTLIKLCVSDADAGSERVWYYLHTLTNAATVKAITSGVEPPPRALWLSATPPLVERDRPTVFRLYEQNIGPLTPLIAQRLLDALEQYPQAWIEDAIGEAVSYNRRSWRYINRILENWQAERWSPAEEREVPR